VLGDWPTADQLGPDLKVKLSHTIWSVLARSTESAGGATTDRLTMTLADLGRRGMRSKSGALVYGELGHGFFIVEVCYPTDSLYPINEMMSSFTKVLVGVVLFRACDRQNPVKRVVFEVSGSTPSSLEATVTQSLDRIGDRIVFRAGARLITLQWV
jgi:hypothetical protein